MRKLFDLLIFYTMRQRQRGTLHPITQATWDVASLYRNECITFIGLSHDSNVGRCIPLRNECITFIGTSHDKGNYRYHPSSVNSVDTFPPRGRLCTVIVICLFAFPTTIHFSPLHSIGRVGGRTQFISR